MIASIKSYGHIEREFKLEFLLGYPLADAITSANLPGVQKREEEKGEREEQRPRQN